MKKEETIYNAIVLKEPAKIEPYWSNCIIEAIRAKRRDPSVRFIMIWPWQNEVWCPHLMWTNGVFEYDFHATNVPMLGWIWYKGHIRVKPVGWASSYINGMQSLRQRHRKRVKARRFAKRNGR